MIAEFFPVIEHDLPRRAKPLEDPLIKDGLDDGVCLLVLDLHPQGELCEGVNDVQDEDAGQIFKSTTIVSLKSVPSGAATLGLGIDFLKAIQDEHCS